MAAAARFYGRFYRMWLDLLRHRGGFAIVRYEDALRDPRLALAPVAEALGAVGVPDHISLPERVPYSRIVPEERKAAYLAGEHGLASDIGRTVEANLDICVLGELGYARIPA